MRVAAFESYRNDVKGEQCGALCKLGKFFFVKYIYCSPHYSFTE